YREARIVELDDPRQALLLERLLGAGTTARAGAARALEKSSALRDACRLPLALTLLAFLALERPSRPEAVRASSGEESDDLPANRLELFRRSIETMLASGHRRKRRSESAGGITNPKAALVVLAELSLALQRDRVAGADAGFSELHLLEVMNELRQERSSRVKKLWDWGESTKDFFDVVARKTGVLADYGGPDDWRFFHRQFRELLAAEALLERGQGELTQRARQLKENRDAIPAWAEVLGFACALSKQPLEVLRLLGGVDEDLALRVLPEVENLDPVEALGVLEKGGNWDGDFLRLLGRRWHEQGLELERAREWLFAQVPRAKTTLELAYFYYALEGLAELAGRPLAEGAERKRFDGRFFTACARWPAPEPPALVRIPAGEFLMGSPKNEPERDGDEALHRVRLSEFFLGATAVTNAEYERFDPEHERETFEGRLQKDEAAEHPVVNVSWWEAHLYCRWLGGRLPTEAEWECACRAGTATPFAFGKNVTPEQVNYNGEYPYASGKKGEYRQRTVAVKELAANAWGLCQMHGNVWEWCADWYGEFPIGTTQVDPVGPAEGGSRVLRGGSWFSHAHNARSAVRDRYAPGSRVNFAGFRFARGHETSE
ncbi:MAG TPA: formylglycine-generating enzyme family protein, partial [Polyangiaceae bacterium]